MMNLNQMSTLALLLSAFVLPACSTASRHSTGAALRPGESAKLRLVGPPMRLEIENIGRQAIQYTIADGDTLPSTHTLAPGARAVEARHTDALILTILNPGPFPAQVMIDSRSSQGFQFDQPIPVAPDDLQSEAPSSPPPNPG